MINELMKKIGYVKESEIIGFNYLTKKEQDVLRTTNLARAIKSDMFVDYVLNSNTQKFYIKEKGKKKAILQLEI